MVRESTSMSDLPEIPADDARTRRAGVLAALRESGRLGCPADLPLAAHRDELLAAIVDHRVVVVAGATGSGKSTQLPKLCLDLGHGVDGLVGHTQPRRVAARSIAERIAEETGTELGTAVGYTVRFTDTVSDSALVKVMTDGILLAEIQRDRMLRRYQTLIIDEAHERSLNIDFLLGYVGQLLPRRPDLRLIITSATIDTQRFADHFSGLLGRAVPIVEVGGRSYPVEIRHRPLVADGEEPIDQVQGIIDAVDELEHEGDGDVLVFLSGEREIHDTADALRRHFTSRSGRAAHTEVLPLYARLSAVEQHRIFQPHRGRRIVLSTNVAETSLTVPGVRYVVDTGTARVSRYSHRLKVQRLPIEPVSQASAEQRAGRCGRVAPGVCIRLYDEDDFAERPAFTEPEILRTNLASVILQMTALGLGDVERFPFVEPPDHRAVRDGYATLEELGALEPPDARGRRRLTRTGTRLARLPIDPRLGRMVLEAERHGCVREVLVIAAALSIQDPRERPAEQRAAADEAHRRFEVPGSDFLTLVKLWDHLREQQRTLTGNQFRRLCRSEHLNYMRVREWHDLFSQLRQVAGQLGVRPGSEAGHPDRVHQAVLAGLLSHLGMRDGTTREYRGAHGSRFMIGRGSAVSGQLPKWVVAAELVETNRLWARTVAAVQPEWAERIAPHLVKRSYGEPRWDPRRGGAVCGETVTLLGLPIVSNRTIGYDRVDGPMAREFFIRHALVDGDWTPTRTHGFVEHNRRVLADLAGWAARIRSPELIDDEAVFQFYDTRLGPDVVTTRHFESWWKRQSAADPDLLSMRIDDLVRGGTSGVHEFPTSWVIGTFEFPVTYRFEPGDPLDGATVHIPLAALNQIDATGFDWSVPGFRGELVEALLKSLPKDQRRELVPMGDVIERVQQRLGPPGTWEDGTSLVAAVASTVRECTGVVVPVHGFDLGRTPPHLRLSFSIDDADGRPLSYGKDLAGLRERMALRLRAELAGAGALEERRGITSWDVGDLAAEVSVERNGVMVRAYPALLDDGESVSLRVFSTPELQHRVMRGGVRRLLLLAVPVRRRAAESGLDTGRRLAVAACAELGVTMDGLVDECTIAAADALLSEFGVPRTAAGFEDLVTSARDRLPSATAGAVVLAADVCVAASAVLERLARLTAPSVADGAADAAAQLRRLVRAGFVTGAGSKRLPDVVRYVSGIDHRLARLPEDPTRDRRRMADVTPLEHRYRRLVRRLPEGPVSAEVIDVGWQLEELRVSLFAQHLGTRHSVSTTRVARALDELGA